MTPADGGSSIDPGCPTGLAPPEADRTDIVIDPRAFVKVRDGVSSLDILVRGAKCGGCLSKIEGGVSALDGIDAVRMNLTTGRLRVEWRAPQTDPARILQTLNDLGYGATPFDPDEAETQHSKREKQLLAALAVAGFAAANIMLLSVSVWAGKDEMGAETRALLHWVSAGIALPAALFAGRPFFRSAYDALKSGHVNMDVPISLAVLLALGMSVFETLNHGPHTYFDAAVMLLFFLLIGRFLDARLQREAQSAARDLAAMQAVSVTRIRKDGVAESLRASLLSPGDTIQIAPGERFAVDAEIIDGASDLDTRMVTGEVRPSEVGTGAHVYSGSVNITRALKARVLASAEDSMLSEIGKLLETGEQKRSSYRKIADKAAQLYVPIVHTLAAGSFIGWMLLNGDVKHALFIAIAVLIITCPCALALAAPVVQVVAVGRLFRKSVYMKSGDALERVAACTHVVFDKTGTLTQPTPVWRATDQSAQFLRLAAQLARGSRHPYSRALALAAGQGEMADDITENPGQGVEGLIEGQHARLGSARWVLGASASPLPASSWPTSSQPDGLYFQIGDNAPVVFEFDETPVNGSDRITDELTARGLSVEILSGDTEQRVADLATRMGITSWRSQITPMDKANHLETLEQAGAKVLMIGDGLNDAGAIAKAHASLTPGGAVDISRSASDGVYAGDDLLVIIDIIDTARKSRSRMLENFGFAALYNVIAVPFAIMGFITPLIAAIAMSGSSLVVTLNALRLNFERDKRLKS